MIEHLGYPAAARDLERAVTQAVADGARTPDLGGTSTTREVADAIVASL
jgi:isocitrate/isopropylmalate dehydrogenase